MKVSSVRMNGQKPTLEQAQKIARRLQGAFDKAGYLTEVSVVKPTLLNISKDGCSFKVDADKLGKTFKRYSIDGGQSWKKLQSYRGHPAWSQRVDFNNLLNSVLDALKVSANVGGRGFVVRSGFNAISDWGSESDQFQVGAYTHETFTEKEAREQFPGHFQAKRAPKLKLVARIESVAY
jgi:hypothetical protein